MKKFVIIYIVIVLVLITLIVTKGVSLSVEFGGFNDYKDRGIVDGFSGTNNIMIVNFIAVIVSYIVSAVITFMKNNKTKLKYLIFAGIIIISLLVPTNFRHETGGIAGETRETYTNIVMLPLGGVKK